MPYKTKWRDQCEAARLIRDKFGLDRALAYLVNEKFRTFVQVADDDRTFADDVPAFAAELKTIFTPEELRAHLLQLRRRRVDARLAIGAETFADAHVLVDRLSWLLLGASVRTASRRVKRKALQ
jgi:hypothetical protein